MKSAALIIALAFVGLSSAQNVAVSCVFRMTNLRYSCDLTGVTIVDNPNANFMIIGQHPPGLSNDDVQRIQIINSNIPFIITQLFTTFPNIVQFQASNSGLTRIQSNAFTNAGSLQHVIFTANDQLTTIQANAFTGATSLITIDLLSNSIDTIHETAFTGLTSLINLYADGNRIHNIPLNLFRPLISLETLFLSRNLIESLDGRLFSSNSHVVTIKLNDNHIDAIGRNFFDGIPRLRFLNTLGNNCTDDNWTIGGVTTIETVRQGLATCFDNFGEIPEDGLKTFHLELIGTLTILDEDGNEIISL